MKVLSKHINKIVPVFLVLVLIGGMCLVGSLAPSASGTGAGLAEWAMKAYKENWKYKYGGEAPKEVDCSGLIYSYCGGARTSEEQLKSATESGKVSSGIPRVHGLGLFQPGHVGVYVGNGMAVDARDKKSDMCYQSTAAKSWTKWFKLSAVTYPDNGWVKYNGKYYYYENGEYVVNTKRFIDGKTYNFSSTGESAEIPESTKKIVNNESEAVMEEEKNPDDDKIIIKSGTTSQAVKKLQERLSEIGFYSGPVTGYFGDETKKAYKAFEKVEGVEVDGEVSNKDFDTVNSDEAATSDIVDKDDPDTVSVGDNDKAVSKIQKKLAKLKYYNREMTGYYGPATKKAVKQFQKDNSIDTTGIVGKATKSKLFSDKAKVNPVFSKKTNAAASSAKAAAKTSGSVKSANPVVSEAVKKDVKSGVKVAHNVVLKTTKISKKALSGANSAKKADIVSNVEEKNTNFMQIMLIVIGIAVFVSGVVFILNHRKKKVYSAAHTRVRRKNNATVRYW